MDALSNNTQQRLIDHFKELMVSYPFHKITIKMITDGADVIRPTFYNHFRDKHEMFEVILDNELFVSLYDLLDIDMGKEATKMIFVYFDKNRLFYENAFKVTGQNSFRMILTEKVSDIFLYLVDLKKSQTLPQASVLTKDQLVNFSAMNLVLILEMWITSDENHLIDADQMYEAYTFLMTHNLEDFFETE